MATTQCKDQNECNSSEQVKVNPTATVYMKQYASMTQVNTSIVQYQRPEVGADNKFKFNDSI